MSEIVIDWFKPVVDIQHMHEIWFHDDASRSTDSHPNFLVFKSAQQMVCEVFYMVVHQRLVLNYPSLFSESVPDIHFI